MLQKHFNLFILAVIATFIVGCKTHWATAVEKGKVPENTFEYTVDFDINSKLIFVPVEIGGTTYRFLFDSGAPCSISKEINEKHGFKALRSGHIRDTDNNRARIDWALVDCMKIGELLFENQSAFVGDFTANPVLACLKVDGIIGSNNIKFCNWIVDVQAKQMTLTNLPIDSLNSGAVTDFTHDRQWNITLPIEVGNVALERVHLDFGSNGEFGLSKAQFDILAAHHLVDSIYVQKGVRQTGIIGKVTPSEIKLSRLDSISMGDICIPKVEINSGTSRILGNSVTSNYLVSIDSEHMKLYFKPYENQKSEMGTFGFQPGHSDSLNMYIQAVTLNGPADKAGLKANMQILAIDTLDFENKHSICDYMEYNDLKRYSGDSMEIIVKDANGQVLEITLPKQPLFD